MDTKSELVKKVHKNNLNDFVETFINNLKHHAKLYSKSKELIKLFKGRYYVPLKSLVDGHFYHYAISCMVLLKVVIPDTIMSVTKFEISHSNTPSLK